MISAKEARRMTDNDIYSKELKDIEKRIINACSKGYDFITKEGYIHSETERKLQELGFKVSYIEKGFYDSEETMIEW